ncbi:hypothetical protein [Saccharothrix yanglingensis]|uniref:Uncharacterized protein n=1 Tax=Saccharothrix yanglingensis TaxID=659496 RepID=A0ABU0X173_9PSEU|nr:hypothetical protein [Saccharothrix yanglingensis]MDQ2585881.1 hypothetical protein [Saccharothrix yanglingensis]
MARTRASTGARRYRRKHPDRHRDGDTDGDTDDGSAGVREPRHPVPPGPAGGTGERPIPDDPTVVEETQCLTERP